MIILSRYKKLTLNEIAKKVKIHENSVRLVLKKLKAEGVVDSIIVKTAIKRNSVKKYFLTEKAEQAFKANFALLLCST
ncbi:MAG: Rrf2 family transcriptional regulator [Candidatus Andersenbacteria bacterium]|nr:Rrf2 family transcriptional regulator [Candidatus Andersenbacteria bacterium]